MEEYVRNGEKLFRAMYRDTADKVQGLLDEIYPDMGRCSDPRQADRVLIGFS